jgi:hypothetical protein
MFVARAASPAPSCEHFAFRSVPASGFAATIAPSP